MLGSNFGEHVTSSTLCRLVDQYKQWRTPPNKPYVTRYLLNTARIVVGLKPVDYEPVSPRNIVVNAFIRGVDTASPLSPANKVVSSPLYTSRFTKSK